MNIALMLMMMWAGQSNKCAANEYVNAQPKPATAKKADQRLYLIYFLSGSRLDI